MVSTMQPLEDKLYMMIYYKYIYYRLYRFFLTISVKDIPEWNAHLVLTFLCMANTLGIYAILKALKIINKLEQTVYAKIIIVAVFIIFGYINYSLCMQNGGYDKIKEKYDTKNLEFNWFLGKVIFILFCTFWLFSLIILTFSTRS